MKFQMNKLLYVSLTAIAILLISCKKYNDQYLLTLEGHVYDYTTGKPIQGVDLTCT